MKVRNIINKAGVAGSSLVMAGATVMGAMAYDLADYPTDFIVDGQFDGKIVVGEQAATSDVLGAIDIAASLQADSVTQEEVDVPGLAGEVSLDGDAFRIETSSDLLELRESIGEVYDTLTDAELEALRGGTITTDEGSTDYNQFLRFGDSAASALQQIAVNYAEDENDELGDYLVIADDEPLFEWEIEFTEGLEAEDESGELSDLEDEIFNIFGTDFTFVNSDIDSTSNNALTLEFMAGDVSDTLREGETKTYTIDGVDYEVTAVFISDPSSGGTAEAKFAVNGEITDSLADGDTDTLNNGLQIGVRDLLVNSREGVVEFFLGANKIEFTDSDTTDTNFNSGVTIGNENIEDAEVQIVGQYTSGSIFEITNIKYRLEVDAIEKSDVYVPAGAGLREFLDEPEGLLSPTFDIRYEGLKEVSRNPISIDASGDDEYEITATNLRGSDFTWPLATNEDGAPAFKWGDDDDDFWFTETGATVGGDPANATASDFFVGFDDYFVLSEGTTAAGDNSEKDDSAVWQYDDIDTSERLLSFTNVGTGATKQVSYTTETTNPVILGTANNFVSEGNTYTIWVGNSTSSTPYANSHTLEHPLMIDVNGDGNVSGAVSTFTVHGGGVLTFDADGTEQVAGAANNAITSGANFNMSLATPSNQFDDSNKGGDELNWTISARSGNEVGLGGVSYAGPLADNSNSPWGDFEFEDGEGDNELGMTDYGAMLELDDPEGDNEAESLYIEYPGAQVGAQVFVTAGTVERSAGGAGGISRDVVNPIAVGLAVLDVDAEGMMGNENLIIVGGPCANTVASEFLGNPANCAEGFEPGMAMISSQESGDNVAILVAGYEAQETLGASYVLSDYSTYLADVEGSEVEVVATDLSDLQVSSPSSEETEE